MSQFLLSSNRWYGKPCDNAINFKFLLQVISSAATDIIFCSYWFLLTPTDELIDIFKCISCLDCLQSLWVTMPPPSRWHAHTPIHAHLLCLLMYPFPFDSVYLLNESGRCWTADALQGSSIDWHGCDERACSLEGAGLGHNECVWDTEGESYC